MVQGFYFRSNKHDMSKYFSSTKFPLFYFSFPIKRMKVQCVKDHFFGKDTWIGFLSWNQSKPKISHPISRNFLYLTFDCTVWKFCNFPVTQILREIKFCETRVTKCAIFDTFRDSEFWFLCIFALLESWNLPKLKVKSL